MPNSGIWENSDCSSADRRGQTTLTFIRTSRLKLITATTSRSFSRPEASALWCNGAGRLCISIPNSVSLNHSLSAESFFCPLHHAAFEYDGHLGRRPVSCPQISASFTDTERMPLTPPHSNEKDLRALQAHTHSRTSDDEPGAAALISALFSMADIMAVLYGGVLRTDPGEPRHPSRDRFILSEGHAGAGVYASLAERGFFPVELLSQHYRDGSKLSGHVSHKGIPGVELSTGSLGHGLSVAAGMAYAAKLDTNAHRVFCLMSDGECDEGSVWEAVLFAGHHRLDQLVAVIDYNKIQSLAAVAETWPSSHSLKSGVPSGGGLSKSTDTTAPP